MKWLSVSTCYGTPPTLDNSSLKVTVANPHEPVRSAFPNGLAPRFVARYGLPVTPPSEVVAAG